MTLPEYLYRMKAHALAAIDKERDMHLQAWLMRDINMTETVGKKETYRHIEFNKFFDYEKRIEAVNGVKEKKVNKRMRNMAQAAKRANLGKERMNGD